jgi:predicted DNA repair protein MutK
MASGFFALLDDIAALMDDVALMSKVATKKTAGILGDDLAVNAEKASGFMSDREIPVLWAITKGSFLNKLIILPFAFLLSALLPAAITVILVLGGVYLAYEGAEKVLEFLGVLKHHEKKNLDIEMTNAEILALEKERVKSAIVTDFILSVEIVIIALGTVTEKEISIQIIVVTIIAILATVGVYGIVALIVRMDEFGLKLINLNEQEDSFSDKVGHVLVNALPWVIKSLAIIGTIALLLVAGGIFAHNIHWLHEHFNGVPGIIKEFIVGLVFGGIAVLFVEIFKKIFKK